MNSSIVAAILDVFLRVIMLPEHSLNWSALQLLSLLFVCLSVSVCVSVCLYLSLSLSLCIKGGSTG